jgi:hypothetical protein
MDGSGTADQVERAAPSPGGSTAGATHTREADPLTVTRRLQREGRWREIEPVRDQMMRVCRKQGMNREQAQAWTYAELDRIYPPLPSVPENPMPVGTSEGAKPADGHLRGLSNIPPDWPTLPDNAPLPAELSWVQAQRLRIVEERPSGATVVHLERAGSPAPSWAALGWLETSIRSYAKFVDICAKGLAQQELESDMVKRERKSIEEVRALLAEMLE